MSRTNTIVGDPNSPPRSMSRTALLTICSALALVGCGEGERSREVGSSPTLAAPFASESAVNFSKVIGWPENKTPVAPEGFTVERFADKLISPRWTYVLPNGDVLIAESSTLPDRDMSKESAQGLRKAGSIQKNANRITLLRDNDGDGNPELRRVFLRGLNQPFGMLLLGDDFYVANTNALMRFDYKTGQTRIDGEDEKILDLPAGGYNNHWTRNVIASRDGQKLYVSVGSATNVDEEGIDIKDGRRAAILEINPDGSGLEVLADGLRNPNGMDWAPGTTSLWTVVNERDELGNELVPDYLTDAHRNAFYGWPYAYFGSHEDPRHEGERPDLVRKSTEPDYALGAHTASLGLQFYTGKTFPKEYWGDALISQHGSWNRAEMVGYKVISVPFEDGLPAGAARDFLTGFVADRAKGEVYGRPVGLAVMNDGSVLVTDDAAGVVWRVAAATDTTASARTVVGLQSPESAVQMPNGEVYVSEIGEFNKTGDGGIALVTPEGQREDYVDGLDDPKGLAQWGAWLYVADTQGVWRIDRFKRPVLLAGPKDFPEKFRLLNDLTVTGDGTLYVSDMGNRARGEGAVYAIDQTGAVKQVFAADGKSTLRNPNGLLLENGETLLATDFYSGELHRIELASGETTRIAKGLGSADGLVKTHASDIYVSDFKSGEIFRVDPGGKVEPLGMAERFDNAADIALSDDGNILIVPDMEAGELAFLPAN
ncbi:MAG: SMP-30/gluconolactonase/LRE family protein [Gammaproteobacteria bacterium]|nr:SMP-30/gluconolactonase/LRE family protein [Gammaproteobacteria bacterium]